MQNCLKVNGIHFHFINAELNVSRWCVRTQVTPFSPGHVLITLHFRHQTFGCFRQLARNCNVLTERQQKCQAVVTAIFISYSFCFFNPLDFMPGKFRGTFGNASEFDDGLPRFKAQRFVYVPQGLTFKNSIWRSLCVECFVRISEQTATSTLDSIN